MMDIVEWLRWNAKEQGSRFGEAADEIEKLRDEIFNLKTEVHFDDQMIKSLQVMNERLRELLQKWLGNCFVDVYGNGVTFGMGVRKVWAETRDALKEGE